MGDQWTGCYRCLLSDPSPGSPTPPTWCILLSSSSTTRAEKWPCTPLSPPYLPSTSATSASRTRSLSSFPLSLRRLLSIYREFLATDHSPLGTLLFLLVTNF